MVKPEVSNIAFEPSGCKIEKNSRDNRSETVPEQPLCLEQIRGDVYVKEGEQIVVNLFERIVVNGLNIQLVKKLIDLHVAYI
jgi:hypothetical protein